MSNSIQNTSIKIDETRSGCFNVPTQGVIYYVKNNNFVLYLFQLLRKLRRPYILYLEEELG